MGTRTQRSSRTNWRNGKLVRRWPWCVWEKAEEVLAPVAAQCRPRLRSFIVNWLNPLGADPEVIAAELERIDPGDQAAARRSPEGDGRHPLPPRDLTAAGVDPGFGDIRYGRTSPGEREPLTGKLLDLYRNDPDAGIHGAAEWTLRQWKQQEKLKAIDAELMKLKDRATAAGT